MSKGFTLIEVLVTVLIIGILTSVALPHYQRSVLKSRLGSIMANTAEIGRALEVYYESHSHYPEDDDSTQSTLVIDIGISGCSEGIGGVFYCADATYDYEDRGLVGGFLLGYNGLGYVYYCSNSTSAWGAPDERQCWADSTSKVANDVCVSLGGVLKGTNGWRTESYQTHSKGTWNVYTLH